MPIYSTKEFKRIFDVSTQYISVNKKRGKLVVQGKFIDSEVPENKQWIEEWKAKNGEPEGVVVSESKPKPKSKAKPKSKKDEPIIPDRETKKLDDIKIPDMPDYYRHKIRLPKNDSPGNSGCRL